MPDGAKKGDGRARVARLANARQEDGAFGDGLLDGPTLALGLLRGEEADALRGDTIQRRAIAGDPAAADF